MRGCVEVHVVHCFGRRRKGQLQCRATYLALGDVREAGNVCPFCGRRPKPEDLGMDPTLISNGAPLTLAALVRLTAAKLTPKEALRRLRAKP